MKQPKPWIRFITDAPEGGSGENLDAPEVEAETGEAEDEAEEESSNFDPKQAMDKIRKANNEAKNQRERAKAAEAKAAAAGDATSRAEKAERKVMQLETALKFNLPATIASRLQGDTPEELAADAEELLKLFTTKPVPSDRPKPKLKSGLLTDDDADESAASIVKKALGR
jgi:hypothetical protein